MLVTHTERPRELKWYHAGPMLYGDWGTSRFYVLGLAFFFALHASFYYVLGVGVLVAAVGWAYTIVCRCYPDGGGVYSAAKHTSRTLAVIGALLLFADYIVTAALSALDGMHYLGIPDQWVPVCAIIGILLIGAINYIGPRKAGTFALVVALATLVLTLVLTAFTIPHLAEGWKNIHKPAGSPGHQWLMLVNVILALSGVEAIANMTGIMVPPVAKTSKKAIWPVLIEVVLFNIILAIGMNAIPNTTPGSTYDRPAADYKLADKQIEDYQKAHTDFEAPTGRVAYEEFVGTVGPHSTQREIDIKNKVLRVMGEVFIGHWFAVISGIVFGLLLISAVNTAVADMISIQYVMSRDNELPHTLTKLNVFGVPWIALIPAIGLPVIILCLISDLESLADLYAIGVVGAIGINLGSCCYNKDMPLKKYERIAMGVLALIMACIEATLAYQKPPALFFASSVLIVGLVARFFTKTYPLLNPKHRGLSLLTWTTALLVCALIMVSFTDPITTVLHSSVAILKYGASAHYALYACIGLLLMSAGSSASYGIRYLLGKVHVTASPAISTSAAAPVIPGAPPAPGEQIDMSKPRVLVATRGGKKLIDFAANYCRKTNSVLFVLFIRKVNVVITGSVSAMTLREDPDAAVVFQLASETCQKQGVQVLPIYAVSQDVPYTILDFAVTYGVEALLMGVSREGAVLRALRGDVLTAVADNLPSDIPLLIHA